ncbi:uncharacterized protein LOC119322501 [Triticum dicoccoides]|uniref:uncharacterized protein LOC119322501 n=1 Tax=Triticum dicoccoides TaxID=85692 RepID=UPI0018919080|nr:uncharacterized protein LOC119322501 [Triticum dicoccoides]
MLWSNHQIWMRIDNLAQENVALRSLIVKNEVNAKTRLMDLTYKLIYSGVAASIGTVVYYLTPALEYLWYEMLHKLAEREREQEEEAARAEAETNKPPKEEEGSGTNKPPKEEEGSGTDKPPNEEEVGGPKQSLKVEDDGGVNAKSPKEEEKHGKAAEPPKKWGFFGL